MFTLARFDQSAPTASGRARFLADPFRVGMKPVLHDRDTSQQPSRRETNQERPKPQQDDI